jgi:P-type Cu+ transporter
VPLARLLSDIGDNGDVSAGSNPFVVVGAAKLERDPVCGMNVDPATAAGSFAFQGTTYHFCGKSCLIKFQAEPGKYLHPAATPEQMPAGVYTCPMHPEVEQDGFGTCPICGMALEPRDATAAPEDDTELRDMTRRFWIAAALAAPIMVLGMAGWMPAWQ